MQEYHADKISKLDLEAFLNKIHKCLLSWILCKALTSQKAHIVSFFVENS